MRTTELRRFRAMLAEVEASRAILHEAVARRADELAAAAGLRRGRRRRAAAAVGLVALFAAGFALAGPPSFGAPSTASTCAPGSATVLHPSITVVDGVATARFSIASGCDHVTVSLASYEVFGPHTTVPETLFESDTGSFGEGGPYTLTARVPDCTYEVELVTGLPLETFLAGDYGDRLVAFATGGTGHCAHVPPPPTTTAHTTTTAPPTTTGACVPGNHFHPCPTTTTGGCVPGNHFHPCPTTTTTGGCVPGNHFHPCPTTTTTGGCVPGNPFHPCPTTTTTPTTTHTTTTTPTTTHTTTTTPTTTTTTTSTPPPTTTHTTTTAPSTTTATTTTPGTTTHPFTPPPPPPPAQPSPLDVLVTKVVDKPSVSVGAQVTYTLTVTNSGPGSAAAVTLVDPVPAQEQFVSVSDTKSCTGGAVVTCSFGTLAAGVSRSVTVVALAQTPGTATNVATVSTTSPETNTANNQASATVVISGPFTPPKPCPKLTLHGRALASAHQATIVARVTRQGKPLAGARVEAKGAGIDVVRRTNSAGVARFDVKPHGAGVVSIRIAEASACPAGPVLLRVRGPFKPPRFTG